MKLREKLLFKLTEIFLKRQKSITLEGPLFYENALDRELIMKAIDFRTRQNLMRSPYLEEETQREIEKKLRIDERSAHFISRKNHEIVISLRLTPGPFELSSLSRELSLINDSHKDFWEFSRLCTDVNLPQKGKFSKFLLIKAGLWLFSKTKAKGIVAICQSGKIKYMSKFALYPEKNHIEIENRIGSYAFLSAPRHLILFRFMREFFSFSTFKTQSKKIPAKTQLVTQG